MFINAQDVSASIAHTALSKLQWCRAANISPPAFYDLPVELLPLMVKIGRRERVIETPEQWRARIGPRWGVRAWCRLAKMGPATFYALPSKDRPHRDGKGIYESPADWWLRRGKEQREAIA
jgi:hypothetical protein